MLGGEGGSGGVIFHMFSAIHQNASKTFLSHSRHFYFFPCNPQIMKRKQLMQRFMKIFDKNNNNKNCINSKLRFHNSF